MEQVQNQHIAVCYATILGQMVKKMRETKNVDQSQLAQYLGVSVMTVSRIESGDTILDVPQMEKVAKFFKQDPLSFFQKSLEIKKRLEDKNYKVLQNKKELNTHPELALISIAALLIVLVAVLAKK